MKMTPTALKKLDQVNVEINSSYYTYRELENLVNEGHAFVLTREFEIKSKVDYFDVYREGNSVRIMLEDVKEITVKMDESKMLTTVAVMEAGFNVYVRI